MNFKGIVWGIKLGAKQALNFTKRHLPQIMVIGGVGGFVGTAVASGKAALKAKDILDEKDHTLELIEKEKSNPDYSEQSYENDKKIVKTQAAWNLCKTFALPVTLAAASTALTLGGHHILGRRAAAALASAYEAQKKLYKYDSNVVEQLGEETAQKLRDGLDIDKLKASEDLKKLDTEEKKKPKKVERHTVDWLFCEESCGARFLGHGIWCEDPEENLMKVLRLEEMANDILRSRGSLTVNTILTDLFDADPIDEGIDIGWVWDEKYGYDVVDFGLGDLKSAEGRRSFRRQGEPNIWLQFNVRQKPENISLGDINKRRHSITPKMHYYH